MKEINLADYFRIVFKYWKFIALIFFAAVITTFTVCTVTPKTYRATAVIYVNEGGLSIPGAAALSSMVSGLIGSTNADLVISLLMSDKMKDLLNEKFRLATNPEFTHGGKPLSGKKLREALDNALFIDIRERGTVNINAFALSPLLASKMANAAANILDGMITSKEHAKRVYLEQQLDKNKAELKDAEEKLRDFQAKNDIVEPTIQIGKQLEAFNDLDVENFKNSAMLQGVESVESVTGSMDKMDELKDKDAELRALSAAQKTKIDEFKSKFEKAPDLLLEYKRLARDVAVKEKVFEGLSQAYYMALINEKGEGKKYEIIDKAIPPLEPAKPRRIRMTGVAGLASLILGVIACFFIETFKSMKTENAA
ncbi:MAG TPA: GNVR domain-containing protein [bacterium]|nr:GNVR domain-containing protein [bacterium]